MEDESQKDKRVKGQTRWRILNSTVALCALAIAAFGIIKVPEVLEVIERQAYDSEISEIIVDEGIRYKVYKDSLGKATVGVGHLVLKSETFTRLNPRQVLELLRSDYAMARANVESRYKWATGDVKMVLINMSYQMGSSRLHKFKKMLAALKAEDYDTAAIEMLDSMWARQTPSRANKLTGRILSLESSWW